MPLNTFEHKENISPTWKAPELAEELSELERTSSELHIPLSELTDAFQQGTLAPLDEETWGQLLNTDSADDTWTVEEVWAFLREHGREPEEIDAALTSGGFFSAPSVLFRVGERPYLLSGNTRLLLSRVHKISPMMWKVSLEHTSSDATPEHTA